MIALTALLSGVASADEKVAAFRAKMDKWVETRQVISKERSDWDVERETLRATRDLLREEKKTLEEEIARLGETNTQADDERNDLLLKRGAYQRSNAALLEELGGMEARVRALAPQLPAPLQARLEPLLVQIPEDPEATVLQPGQRLMNVLGVLAQAEKFNGTATLVGETRAVDGDRRIQIRTLYWGLGQAIFVDTQGETAGVGRPGEDGWRFDEQPGIAHEAKLLVDIYEGNVDDIEFVRLPVEITAATP